MRISSVEENRPVGHYVGSGTTNHDPSIDRFGCLKHPLLSPAIVELLTWLFNRGNIKGNSKSSPSAMISIAAMYGTESVLFVNDVFWDSAITRSSGRRIFSDAEIPEEWQVKQYISQMSTLVKAKSKAVAGVEMLSPEDKLLQLNTYISEIPGLSVETNLLSTAILSLGVELSYIKQKDIRVKVKELGVSSTIMMRGIIEACKKVGKPVTNIIRPLWARMIGKGK